jgi:hypothetical protein
MVKFDKIVDIVIINQNTSWFRLFQGPTIHKIGLNYKHSSTKPKHMV